MNKSYDHKNLRNILSKDEKILYDKILEDIGKNNKFYSTSTPEEITSHLINNCGFDKESVYKLFKKISLVNEGGK